MQSQGYYPAINRPSGSSAGLFRGYWKERYGFLSRRLRDTQFQFEKILAHCLPGGHLRPDPYNVPSTLLARHGPEAASEFAQFEADHIPALERLVKDERIDCDFVMTRGIDVFLTRDLYLQMRERIQMLRDNHVAAARDIICVAEDEAEQVWNQLMICLV